MSKVTLSGVRIKKVVEKKDAPPVAKPMTWVGSAPQPSAPAPAPKRSVERPSVVCEKTVLAKYTGSNDVPEALEKFSKDVANLSTGKGVVAVIAGPNFRIRSMRAVGFAIKVDYVESDCNVVLPLQLLDRIRCFEGLFVMRLGTDSQESVALDAMTPEHIAEKVAEARDAAKFNLSTSFFGVYRSLLADCEPPFRRTYWLVVRDADRELSGEFYRKVEKARDTPFVKFSETFQVVGYVSRATASRARRLLLLYRALFGESPPDQTNKHSVSDTIIHGVVVTPATAVLFNGFVPLTGKVHTVQLEGGHGLRVYEEASGNLEGNGVLAGCFPTDAAARNASLRLVEKLLGCKPSTIVHELCPLAVVASDVKDITEKKSAAWLNEIND